MAKVGNLDANLGGYFELSFTTTEVGNFHGKLGGYFMYFFIIAVVGNFLIKYNKSNGYYR
jgi:hypothetical protein